ncbi:metal-dependent amidase/aminoacylase/carboxypeptidase family protein [Amycolatopsis sulphurea]|uniref:Metal-dependent amidase/aminoacylase/carboxypeptidase family protein n=1 Tax=Amycolatopsis sulphurea TaxID=76022 RepID=A0A2A9FGV3_9PSEU|nr:hypothetical protein [Amycolatopsis sulphurea]PFG50594.1 metal-dependent amidase/aminoacylase/carboxypeptidase family protein [Amycolatopsis sulphurea]
MEADENRHDRVDQEIGRLSELLWALSRDGAADAGLPAAGFSVTRADRGFLARHGEGRPCVAFLAPGERHPEQGHRLITAAALGAALATSRVTAGQPGAIVVVAGVPVPDGVTAALTFRPGGHTWSPSPLAARAELRVSMHGRPGAGIDALTGLVQTFTAVSALRPRPGTTVQGIVTRGGESTARMPEFAEARFGLCAPGAADLDRLAADVTACAEGAALATGAKAVVERLGPHHAPLRDNPVLSARFTTHLAAHGIVATPPGPDRPPEWSEVGDVSVRVPTLHPSVAIADPAHVAGTPEFAVAAASRRACSTLLATAAALARTAVDLLAHPSLVRQVQDAFAAEAGQD